MTTGIVSAFCATGLHKCKTDTCSCVCHHSPDFRDTKPEDFINFFADFCYEAFRSQAFELPENLSYVARIDAQEDNRAVFEKALNNLCYQTLGEMDGNFMEALFEVVFAHGIADYWSRNEFNGRLERKGIREEAELRIAELKN